MSYILKKNKVLNLVMVAIIFTTFIQLLVSDNNIKKKIINNKKSSISYKVDEFIEQGYTKDEDEYTTINNDSWFLKTEINTYVDNIELNISSAENIPISIYYTTSEENFSEQQVINRILIKNESNVKIPVMKKIKTIRLDIGDAINQKFKLESINFNLNSGINKLDIIYFIVTFMCVFIFELYIIFLRKKYNIDHFLMSVISICVLLKILTISKYQISNSILALILFISLNFLFKYSIKMSTKRMIICSIPFGVLLSIFFVLGYELSDDYTIIFNNNFLNISFFVVGLSFIFIFLIIAFLYNLPMILQKINKVNLKSINKFVLYNKRAFLITWAIIFICWIPNLLASFPGIYTFDAIMQVNQLRGDNVLSTHHPILHTLYIASCILAGGKLFGSYTIGMAIYSLSQMLIMSCIFAYTCTFIYKQKVPNLIKYFSILFFSILPLNSMYSITATKDVIFAGLILILFIFTIQMFENPKLFCSSLKLQIRYIIIAVLMCLFRNNGIYIIFFVCPFFFLYLKKKNIVIIFSCIITIYLVVNGPIMNALNIKKGDFREALSAPIQMLARTVKDNQDVIDNKELEIIYEILPENTANIYNPILSDPVKSNFNTDVFKKDIKKYLNVWIKIGLKYPQSYINGFLSTNMGFWYPDKSYKGYYMDYDMWNLEGDYILLTRESALPILDKIYQKIAYGELQTKIPIISMLFSPGFYFWFFVFSLFIQIYKKNYKLLISMILYIALWGTLILSPVAIIRYAYPLVCIVPLLISTIFEKDSGLIEN
ncbi:DUF6020 family protein [Clostridium aquiflavi]|uniref:DUF6020 family protein n=1 Tax=Clostridium aquiflavi TaxID=3073603 RepID=A0ABU1EIM7_9CLOT|nr:DUF6020 family protein [Clostridium sp. 5N-1]MDR5588256.1 DUF6020 family protein [Clostridium sp. 5N-1]